MRIIVLEDNDDRQETFRRAFPDTVIVATGPACIERLGAQPWDMIYLDHDLGGNKLPGSDREDCGMVVVRYIKQHRPEHLKLTKFIVHSANQHRARIMTDDLRHAGYDAELRSFINLLPELQRNEAR